MDGTKVIGTRYGCLKKGIGTGLRLPYDSEYARRFVPIDQRKIYCGNNIRLPNRYDILGTLGQCFQKGIGVGRSIKAKKIRKNRNKGGIMAFKRRKSPMKSRRKSRRKSPKKSRRKSRKKSRRKSRKKSRRKSRKKSPMKSRRKSRKKSLKKSSRKSARK